MNLTKSKTARFAAGFVGFAMAVTAIAPAIASADTASDLQAQINSLLATIQALQAQLASITGGSSMSTGYTFNTNLTVGSTGTDVMNLQKVLNMSADTQVAASGVGSPGNETSYFGSLTKAAVMKFQTKYGISPVAGYVGPITRAKLNTMSGGVTTTPGTLPTGGALTISGGIQPANSLAPKGASRVPFTNFTLTAGASDVTVTSITVEKAGLAQDAVFAGVVLLNSSGMQVGIAKTLNSNHQAMVGETMVIKAGTSQTFTVAGNMASSLTNYVGQVAGLNVIAVNSSASVGGSLPISGAMHTINNSLTIGTVTIGTSSFDPNNAGTQPIGTTGFKFTGFRVTAGAAEDITLRSVRWNQTGSAGSSDLSNVVTVVNGTSYPTVVSADGKYFSSTFGNGVVITKGNSIDLYVQGDIVGSGAAGRYAEFDVYKNTDVYLSGNTYGYGITAAVGTNAPENDSSHGTTINTSSNPWLEGSTLSITAGSVTLIGKATEVASANIALNVSNQVLGGFATNFNGEAISIQELKFYISTSTTAAATANSPFTAITNITIVDENGAVVAGPVDAAVGDGTIQYADIAVAATSYGNLTFTDTVTFPTGRHVYTIKGKIPSTWTNGDTVTIFTKPTEDWDNVTGQTTGNNVSLSSAGVFSMNTMTVKAGALAVSVSAQPTSQTLVAGIQGVTLANYVLDATASGEDVRLSSFPVNITDSSISDLTGCQLWNGGTALNTGSRVINGSDMVTETSETFSFDNALVVPKGTSVTLALKCNIGSAATASISVNATAITAAQITVTGQTSGNTITPTVNGTAGAVFALSTGSITGSVDSSSPNYALVAGGTSGVTLGVARFQATNEDVNLTDIGLIQTSGTSANLGTIYLYGPSNQLLGTVVFPQGSTLTATSTLSSPLLLTKNISTLVTIKADMAAIGSDESGVQGRLVKIDPVSAKGTGLSSGSTLNMGSITAAVAGVRTFKSFPTVTKDTLTAAPSEGKLMRFKVTADVHGPISLFNLQFTLATATASVTNVELYVYNDSSYSSPATTIEGSGLFDDTNGQSNGSLLASAPTIDFMYDEVATAGFQIPAGTTRYFELKATVAGATDGASVTTTLNGDAAYIVAAHLGAYQVSTTTGVLADDNDDFIWSGNATTTPHIHANDWSNGYGIIGLPSGGITQTVSQ